MGFYIDNRIYNSKLNNKHQLRRRKCHQNYNPKKMADTSKDELLLGGGINRITTTSRRSKQVPACVSNID